MKTKIAVLAGLLSAVLILAGIASLIYAFPQHDINTNTKQVEYLQKVKSDILSGKRINLSALFKVYRDYYDVIRYVNYLENHLDITTCSKLRSDIKKLYDQWENEKTSDVINLLLELLDEKYRIPRYIEGPEGRSVSTFEHEVGQILLDAKTLLSHPRPDRYAYLTWMRLWFIAPQYKGSEQTLDKLEPYAGQYLKSATEEERKAEAKNKAWQENQKQKNAEKEELLKKYKVVAKVYADELCRNPFQYEGKVILIKAPSYIKMLERNLALFSSSGPAEENQFFVSNIPTDYKSGAKDLIAKGKGATNAVNALGATIKVPLVQYIAECSSY